MIQIGEIVEYSYNGGEGKCYHGIIIDVSDDNFYCWIDWFDFGVEKTRTTLLKVLT
jgi:hypothetical protein